MSELTSTVGIVAMAGVGLALVSLTVGIVIARRLRRLRAAQSAVLGEGSERDLVEHADQIGHQFRRLARAVEDSRRAFEERAGTIEERLDGAITHSAVIRYDAYNEMTGRQSSSTALLDAHRSGVVLSSILHREQARLYAKQIVDGRAELDLSPEEQEAVETALRSSDDADPGP